LYNTRYILPFDNDLDEFYEIYLEYLDFVGDPTILKGTDDVLTLRSTAGDENKLESIIGTEALINIVVEEDTDITIADLVASQDNQIRVTIYRDEDYTKSVFQGFVVVEDNSQPFLDKPFVLSIRALDGLGLLKGVDLEDTDSLRFVGIQSVLSWIAQILHKTGQTLNLRVYFNFFESSFNQNIGALEQVYLSAITFSQGDAFNSTPDDPSVDVNATSADDCYTALEKIVRCFRCRLFQEDGVWNLVSLYEYLNPAGFTYREYQFGSPVSGIVPVTAVGSGLSQDYSIAIGRQEIIHPVNEDQIIYLKLATKWIKLTYNYDQSQNKVCNQDFAEGDRNATYDAVISSSILDPSIQPPVDLKTEGYDVYCWALSNGTNADVFKNPYPATTPDKRAYIRSVLDQLDYEKERYSVIEATSVLSYLESSTFYIDTSDALQISVTARWKNTRAGGPSYGNIIVTLTGDDGTFWAVNGAEGPGIADPFSNRAQWFATNSQFRNAASGFNGTPGYGYEGTSSDKATDWITMQMGSVYPLIAPVSGTVKILLTTSNGPANDEQWYKNLQVTIVPYLQGSYKALKGDYNFSGSNNAIKQTESDDVEISDSPKRYFKGALLLANGDLCRPTWERAGITESFRFAQLMERIMYNHLFRMNQKLEGTWRGLVYLPKDNLYVIRMNGYLGSYSFIEGDEPTKRYMLTSYEKDYATGQWRGVFVETLADQNADGFILPDQYKFSYLFQ